MKVMVAVLDWGLGHACRSMPMVDQLLQGGHEVFVASSGKAATLLQQSYPKLHHLKLEPYQVTYHKTGSQSWAILFQAPAILRSIRKEHQQLRKYHTQFHFDKVISDHRYGCWLPDVESVFLSHQLALIPPKNFLWGRKMLYDMHLAQLKNFSEIWIPDFEGQNSLSGSLSKAYSLPPKAIFVGPLSRFASWNGNDEREVQGGNPEILAIVSGPEPQRSMFEQKLKDLLSTMDKKSWLLRGRPELKEVEEIENLTVYPHVDNQKLAAAMSQAKLVISRSGYSSLMDYAVLGLDNVLLVPTPGQSEQEYLAEGLGKKGFAWTSRQDELSLAYIEEVLLKKKGFDQLRRNKLLDQRLKAWK